MKHLISFSIVSMLALSSCKTNTFLIESHQGCDEMFITKSIPTLDLKWKSAGAEKAVHVTENSVEFEAQQQWEDGVHYNYLIAKNAATKAQLKAHAFQKTIYYSMVRKSDKVPYSFYFFSDYSDEMSQSIIDEIIKMNSEEFDFHTIKLHIEI